MTDLTGSPSKPVTLFSRENLTVLSAILLACMTGLVTTVFLPVQMAAVAALTLFCIGLWATGSVPEFWTAIAFFLIAILLDLAPAETVFSGFHSSTLWLLFSGIILGAAMRHTGLGKRTARLLTQSVGNRYYRVIAGVTFFSLALAFIMPSSMGRIVLLVPILLSLADHLGYEQGRPGRTGMLAAAVLGTNLPAYAILPANAPNMILAGMAESLFDVHLSYWEYLLIHFPVLGLTKAIILIGLILWLFPDKAPKTAPDTKEAPSSLSSHERKLIVILVACLAFWVTDALHHISPGWVGLAAALYCLWPGSGLTEKNTINDSVNYGSLFFVAGIIGLGAVIATSGLGSVLFTRLTDIVDFSGHSSVVSISIMTALSTLVAIIAGLPSVPAVITPIAEDISSITGLSLTTILMTQVVAFSNVLLPYQAPPLIVAAQLSQIPILNLAKICLALFVITVLILIPLDLLWWSILGLI